MSRPRPTRPTRKQLLHQSLVGFCGFFAFLAVVQAVLNFLYPEPEAWPAVLALVLVLLTAGVQRFGRPER